MLGQVRLLPFLLEYEERSRCLPPLGQGSGPALPTWLAGCSAQDEALVGILDDLLAAFDIIHPIDIGHEHPGFPWNIGALIPVVTRVPQGLISEFLYAQMPGTFGFDGGFDGGVAVWRCGGVAFVSGVVLCVSGMVGCSSILGSVRGLDLIDLTVRLRRPRGELVHGMRPVGHETAGP